jgi:hypothetical protein
MKKTTIYLNYGNKIYYPSQTKGSFVVNQFNAYEYLVSKVNYPGSDEFGENLSYMGGNFIFNIRKK